MIFIDLLEFLKSIIKKPQRNPKYLPWTTEEWECNANWCSLRNSCSAKVCTLYKILQRGLLSPLRQEENLFSCRVSSTLDFLEAFFQVKIREAPNEGLQLPWGVFQSGNDPDSVSELNPFPEGSVMNLFSYSWQLNPTHQTGLFT